MAKRQIYLLSPKIFSPETIAVAFAKTSRAPESFREVAAELNEQSSANFHERWVVGYGHASVAEHAVLHIAIENVSRLAVECIESNRLASYTEKSTRYQKWDMDDFFIPSELDDHPLRDLFTRTCHLLFETYTESIPFIQALVKAQHSPRQNESGEMYDRRIRSHYIDSCRFLLPAASLANLGMTANARVLEHAICKMLSHPLAEIRNIGEEVKKVARGETPTLVKYAEASSYLVNTRELFSPGQNENQEMTIVDGLLGSDQYDMTPNDWCQLIDYQPDGETRVLAAAVFRFGEMSYPQAMEMVRSTTEAERVKLAESILGTLREHDIPLRELEHTSYTFELILDQGAYGEFKRHRMMTQTPQILTTRMGYAIPRQFIESGLDQQYNSAMQTAAETYEIISKWNPTVASYIVPNGYNRHVMFTMNLREAFTFCQLRASSNAHYSMRRVAQRVAGEIRRVHPLLARFMRLPEETWQEIEQENLKGNCPGKKTE
jgi:thymidylate synthase ThyX